MNQQEALTDLAETPGVFELSDGQTHALVKTVYAAMHRALNHRALGLDPLWYEDPMTNSALALGESLGWVYRPSVTQVSWTELGAKWATALRNGTV